MAMNSNLDNTETKLSPFLKFSFSSIASSCGSTFSMAYRKIEQLANMAASGSLFSCSLGMRGCE